MPKYAAYPLAVAVALATWAIPAVAAGGARQARSITPKTGQYAPKCPQGFASTCGEGQLIVTKKGTRIAKGSFTPWPNDPADPSIGICGRYGYLVTHAIKISHGRFSAKTTRPGHETYTLTGKWTSRTKLKGTVKSSGCSTVVHYTAKLR
jgi:hypothetical protein